MYLVGETLNHIVCLFDLMAQVGVNIDARYRNDRLYTDPHPAVRLRANVREIRKEIVALMQLYDQLEPQAVLEQALLVVDDMLQSIENEFRVWDTASWRTLLWPPSLLKFQSRKSDARGIVDRKARYLQSEIQVVLNALVEYALDLMPISLSERTAEQVSYGQIRQSPQATVQWAFTLLEDHLRARMGVGPEAFGEALINMAFGKHGRLTYGEVPAEQTGVRNLMSGAYATFRNPRMHRILEDDEHTALAVVALVDLLMQIVDEAEEE